MWAENGESDSEADKKASARGAVVQALALLRNLAAPVGPAWAVESRRTTLVDDLKVHERTTAALLAFPHEAQVRRWRHPIGREHAVQYLCMRWKRLMYGCVAFVFICSLWISSDTSSFAHTVGASQRLRGSEVLNRRLGIRRGTPAGPRSKVVAIRADKNEHIL